MSFVIVASDGNCSLPDVVAPGPYDLEVNNGVVALHPLVRAQGDLSTAPPPTGVAAAPPRRGRGSSRSREYKGRSWSRVPAGTRMTGPHSVGMVTMGPRGELSNGRTPNRHLIDNGITANAWDVYKLDDGRSVGTAYDMNAWP